MDRIDPIDLALLDRFQRDLPLEPRPFATIGATLGLPEAEVITLAAGRALAALPGVTLAYERRPVAGVWPYRLYCMIHARSRPEALAVLDAARALPALAGAAHRVLFSTRCFKQCGARLSEAA